MNLQSLSAVTAIAQIARPAAPADQPMQPQVRSDSSTGFDPRLGKGEAMAAAVFAARAQYDCRATGPSDSVQRFDRIVMVIEGFEHLREILDGQTQQAEEDFGPVNGITAEDAAQQALTAYGSLDLRV
jgi:hypothetical protein